jgi:thiol-disulfide isomerase/thioredoxin
VVALAGIWCGDCAQQCPLIQRIADANPDRIDLRWLDRDAHSDLQDRVMINGGRHVPVLLFCAEDHELVDWYGDRTLSRYRALAAKQLGPSCPLPGAALDRDEAAAVIQDWLNEFERVHLLLRLSTRLRQKYED